MLRPWGSLLGGPQAWGRSQGRLRGASLLQGGHYCCENSDLCTEGSDQAFQVGNLSLERLSLLGTWGFHSFGARASCKLGGRGLGLSPPLGRPLCRVGPSGY